MNLIKLCGMVGVAALMLTSLSISASAFQETRITPGTAVKTDTPEKALTGDVKNIDAAAELAAPSTDANSSEGTEISIPGLGTIGRLPKLDFGLELLYGADEKRDAAEASTTPDDIEPESDVMIRGTVKHRF